MAAGAGAEAVCGGDGDGGEPGLLWTFEKQPRAGCPPAPRGAMPINHPSTPIHQHSTAPISESAVRRLQSAV